MSPGPSGQVANGIASVELSRPNDVRTVSDQIGPEVRSPAGREGGGTMDRGRNPAADAADVDAGREHR